MHAKAITKHTIADNATTLNVPNEPGLIPVAVYAVAWTPATATFGLRTADPGAYALGTTAETYKATDDSAITLVDDTWSTIPETVGRKLVANDWQFIFNVAESGGPIVIQIAWAPLEGV